MPYRLLTIAFVTLSLLAACANNPFNRNPATTPPEPAAREAPSHFPGPTKSGP
jgi:hypothetical protein